MPYEYIPDYIDLHLEHEARLQKYEDKLPKCDHCDEPITGDYLYNIDGVIYCEECLNDMFKKHTEDYMHD